MSIKKLTLMHLLRMLAIAGFALPLLQCQQAQDASGEAKDSSEIKAEEPKNKAETIINQAIETHGQGHYENLKVAFDFRDYHYTAKQENGKFVYTRTFTDSVGQQTYDELTHEGFRRKVEGIERDVPDERGKAYGNSVNSVVYFTLLPAFLQDPAVKSTYLGETTLRGEPYHKVKITFSEQGGGDDYQDEYVYWIHRDEHTVDYLAYNFIENDGGARFREAVDRQRVEGVIFQNYINYKPKDDTRKVEIFDTLLEEDGLEELSRIENENIEVEILTSES